MLPFWLSICVLSLVQAALVAAPRAPATRLLRRLQSRWWALVLPLSIVVAISAIALESASARFLTYLALVAVPPLASDVTSARSGPAKAIAAKTRKFDSSRPPWLV